MVRTYKRKTDRGKTPLQSFEKAYDAVKGNTMSLREAALAYEVDKMTLFRYIKKRDKSDGKEVNMGYAKPRQIFSDELEEELKEYIIHSSKIYYGLTPHNIKVLAYELAMANSSKLTVPDTWINHKSATREWFNSFMKRHPRLSIREPEATSLSRATSFNKTNVGLFYDNLKFVYEKYKFENKDIWNVDETGVQTVQRPNKIVAEKGARQVGKATSAERGQTVTMVMAVSAIGNSIPPMFVFPRVFFKDHFIANGPPGCVGTSFPSGWITGESFYKFIKHFHSHVKSTKEKPCLLLLDNHDSHLSVDVLKFCKDNGIVMLSFPPHTSHRLQPLDISVYGPFKRFYFAAVDGCLINNPGKTLTIYDIPGIVKTALPNAITPKNIVSGFEKTGIAPFNSNTFTDDDFLGCFVTDRACPINDNPSTTAPSGTIAAVQDDAPLRSLPISSISSPSTSGSNVATSVVSPKDIRPFPKAGERKQNKKGKQALKSAILTSTPVKDRLEKEAKEKEERKKVKTERVKKKLHKSLGLKDKFETRKCRLEKKKKITTKRKKHVKDSDSEEEEDALCLICLKPFSESKPGENWIQCMACKRWAHIACGEDKKFYICIHCSSDLESSD